MGTDDEGDTNGEGGQSRRAPTDVIDEPRPTTDKRTLTKRQNERARKARLIEQANKRRQQERAILAVAASGASIREIALEVGLSKSRVEQIYKVARHRLEMEGPLEYREAAMHTLGTLKQAAFQIIMASEKKATSSERIAAMREARHVQDQMNRLKGAYPPIGVDLTGVVVHTVDSTKVVTALGALQAQRDRRSTLAIEAEAVDPVPELGAPRRKAPAASNGSVASNGSAA